MNGAYESPFGYASVKVEGAPILDHEGNPVVGREATEHERSKQEMEDWIFFSSRFEKRASLEGAEQALYEKLGLELAELDIKP